MKYVIVLSLSYFRRNDESPIRGRFVWSRVFAWIRPLGPTAPVKIECCIEMYYVVDCQNLYKYDNFIIFLSLK